MKHHQRRAMIAVVLVLFVACRLPAQVIWYSNGSNPLVYNAIDPSVLYDSTGGYFTMWLVVPGSGIMKAVSFDGLNWFYGDELALAPGALGAFDHLIHAVNVVKREGVYLMYYTASRSGDSLSIGLAVSQDGDHWQKSASSPVLSHGQILAWDARSVAGPKVCFANGLFKMWFGGSKGAYVGTGLATSVDGVSWTKDDRNPVLQHGDPGKVDAMEAGVMGVANRNGLYYMIYRSIDSSGIESFSLATSQDGASWTKFYGNPVKRGSGWDGQMVGGGTLLWLNGLFRFWYSGTGGGAWGLGEAVSEPTPMEVEEMRGSPVSAAYLAQNYPNPFNPSTTIRYGLPNRSDVKLTVFNVLGQQVAVLQNGEQEAGYHEAELDGKNLVSGVYFYRLQAGPYAVTKKLQVLR